MIKGFKVAFSAGGMNFMWQTLRCRQGQRWTVGLQFLHLDPWFCCDPGWSSDPWMHCCAQEAERILLDLKWQYDTNGVSFGVPCWILTLNRSHRCLELLQCGIKADSTTTCTTRLPSLRWASWTQCNLTAMLQCFNWMARSEGLTPAASILQPKLGGTDHYKHTQIHVYIRLYIHIYISLVIYIYII